MLKRVKIQGYKSLEDVEVYLQPLSVCFGPNASGKSNFLDALQLLSRIATSNNLNDAFRHPYRGTPLESFTFGADGIQGLLAKEYVSFTIEVDVEVSQKAIDTVSRLTVTDKTHGDALEDVKSLHQTTWRYRITIEAQPKSGMLNIVDESLNELNPEGEPTARRIWMGRDRMDLQWEGGGTYFCSSPHYLASLPFLPARGRELMAIECGRTNFHSLALLLSGCPVALKCIFDDRIQGAI